MAVPASQPYNAMLQPLVAAFPDPALVIDAAGRIQDGNAAAAALLGFPLGELPGRAADDVFAAEASANTTIATLVASGSSWNSLMVRHRDGHLIPVEGWAGVLPHPNDPGHVVFLRRARTPETPPAPGPSPAPNAEASPGALLTAGHNHGLRLLASGQSLPEVLKALCIALEQAIPDSACSVLLLDDAGERLRHGAAPNLAEDYIRAIDGVHIGPLAGSCGAAAFLKETVVAGDVSTDPRWVGWKSIALEHGLHSCWSAPIMDRETDRVLGTFAVYHREPRTPAPAELALVEQSGDLAGLAIHHARAEAALAASEERLRLALAAARMATWDWDVASGMVVLSPGMAALYGRGPEMSLVNPNRSMQLIHPDDRSAVEASDRQIGIDGGKYHIEYRVVWPSGEERWLREHGEAVPGADGRPMRMLGVTMDVTERRRTERALQESESRFRALVEQLPAVTYIQSWNPEEHGAVAYISPQIQQLVGYSPAESLASPGLGVRLIHPDDQQRVMDLDAATEVTGEPFDAEYRMIARDGRVVWVHERATLVRDETGAPQFWLGVKLDVTAHKDAEQALHASEERLLTLLAQAPAVLYQQHVADPEHASYVSPRVTELLGYTPEEWSSDWQSRLHPEDRKRVLAEVARTDKTGDSFKAEYRERAKDGSWVWMQDESILIRDAEGNADYWLGVKTDITERKEVETALVTARSLNDAVLEQVPDAIYVKDTAGRLTHVNRATLSYLGVLDPIGALGKTDADFLDEAQAAVLRAEESRVFAGASIFNKQHLAMVSGEPRWFLTSKTPLRNADGMITGLVGINRDVTDHVRAEEELRWWERRYRQLFEDAPAMYVVTRNVDGQPIVEDCNELLTRTLGRRRDEVIGRSIADFFTPESQAALREGGFQRALADELGTVERQFLTADGQIVDILVQASAEHDETGAAIGARATCLDITARKQTERALQQAKDDAEEANRLKSVFLSMMSHELRTPLHTIIGYAHLLIDEPNAVLTTQQASDLSQITRSGGHLLDLINDVLDLSRIEAGELSLQPELVSVDVVVQEVIQAVAPQASAKDLHLMADVPAETTVWADPQRLHQVLLNLAGNAVKFTAEGTVALSAREQNGWLQIAVSDTGIGIAADALPHIFAEFRQADSSTTRRYGGSGLGLPIARRLIEAHGGSIHVDSTPGHGSTFTVLLPLGPGSDARRETSRRVLSE